MSTELPESKKRRETETDGQNLERQRYKKMLLKLKFFSAFSETEIDTLLKHASIRKYTLHEYIFREDETDISFYVVLAGKCNVIKTSQTLKKPIKLNEIMEGDMFGEMAVLTGAKRSAGVMSAGESFVMKIQGDHIEEMEMSLQAKLFKQFAIFLAQKLNAINVQAIGL